MEFSKPARTIKEQLALLKQRGLYVHDQTQALHYLKYVTYYRLRAYWLPFELRDENTGKSSFKENTSFQNIVDLYVFDRAFRLLVIDAIERIEIAIRGAWAYHMATKYGSHGYSRYTLYKNKDSFLSSCALLIKEVERSKETFINHYKERYDKPLLPPIWMVSEILSFGQLSQWINNLKEPKDRNTVARVFCLDEAVFLSFLHHVSHVRNICAHHGRLWNRHFTFKMKKPKHPTNLSNSINQDKDKNIYNTLCVIKFLLDIVSPENGWGMRLKSLLDTSQVPTENMGFPADWLNLPIWKNTQVEN